MFHLLCSEERVEKMAKQYHYKFYYYYSLLSNLCKITEQNNRIDDSDDERHDTIKWASLTAPFLLCFAFIHFIHLSFVWMTINSSFWFRSYGEWEKNVWTHCIHPAFIVKVVSFGIYFSLSLSLRFSNCLFSFFTTSFLL